MSAVLHVEARWDGDFADVPAARSWARRQLDALGASVVEWELLQVLSELVSNAAIHAHSPFTVRLDRQDTALRLEVSDESRSGVLPRNYAADATTGRGMVLVQQLTRDWGVTVDASGKTVWAEFSLEGEDSPGDETTEDADLPLHLLAGGGAAERLEQDAARDAVRDALSDSHSGAGALRSGRSLTAH